MFPGWFNYNSGPYPMAAPSLLNRDDEEEFLSLPEEVQQQILRRGATSEKDLHDRLEEYRKKE